MTQPAFEPMPTIDSATYTAARCHCRPGCMTEIRPGDQVIATGVGAALVDHLAGAR